MSSEQSAQDRDRVAAPSGSAARPQSQTCGQAFDILGSDGMHEAAGKNSTLRSKMQTVTVENSNIPSLNSRNSQSSERSMTMTLHPHFKPSSRLWASHSTALMPEEFTSSAALNKKTVITNDITNVDNEALDKSPPASKDLSLRHLGTGSSVRSDSPQNTERDTDSESDKNNRSSLDAKSDIENAEEEMPQPRLAYQIPPHVLLAAQQAPPNTRASYWSSSLYRGPNEEKVSVHYCRKLSVAERVAKHFLNEKAIGFDMEWKPYAWPSSIKQNASLIQIACENRIALFHVALFFGTTPAQLVPPSLKSILENPDIGKVGVNIKGDFTRLRKHLGIRGRGVLELSRLHNLVERPEAGHRICKLSTQVQQHLLLPLYKGEALVEEASPTLDEFNSEMANETGESPTKKTNDTQKSTAGKDGNINESAADTIEDTATIRKRMSVRESDWSQTLKHEQIYYAADDAYAGYRLFDVLNAKRKRLKPAPPLPRFCDDDPTPRSVVKKAGSRKPTSNTAQALKEAIPAIEESSDDAADEYETAPEQALDGNESCLDSGFESESSSESSRSTGDSNGDYVPNNAEWQSFQKDDMDLPAETPMSAKRIGRVKASTLLRTTNASPLPPARSYPEVMSNSDNSRVTGPMPAKPLKRDEDDELGDPVLEEDLMEMDLQQFACESWPENMPALQEAKPNRIASGKTTTSEDLSLSLRDTPPVVDSPFTVQGAGAISQTPEFCVATAWAHTYLSKTIPAPSSSSRPSGIRATTSHLRAYYLWHCMGVPVEDIGAFLNNPPLTQDTVKSHILQAVSLEKLDYKEQRLQGLLGTVPTSLRTTRWGQLLRRLQS